MTVAASTADYSAYEIAKTMAEAGYDRRGIVSGLATATVRATLALLVTPPEVPTVRAVLVALLPAINRAAEQLVPKPPKK